MDRMELEACGGAKQAAEETGAVVWSKAVT